MNLSINQSIGLSIPETVGTWLLSSSARHCFYTFGITSSSEPCWMFCLILCCLEMVSRLSGAQDSLTAVIIYTAVLVTNVWSSLPCQTQLNMFTNNWAKFAALGRDMPLVSDMLGATTESLQICANDSNGFSYKKSYRSLFSNWYKLNLLLSYLYSYLLIERMPSDLESALQWIQFMQDEVGVAELIQHFSVAEMENSRSSSFLPTLPSSIALLASWVSPSLH